MLRANCPSASMTSPPLLRGSGRQCLGSSRESSDARDRWAFRPAWRPLPDWDFPSWPTNRPNCCSDSARTAGEFSSESRARAPWRARLARTRVSPEKPKWGSAHAVPDPPISRRPRDMWSARFPFRGSGNPVANGAWSSGSALLCRPPYCAGRRLPSLGMALGSAAS